MTTGTTLPETVLRSWGEEAAKDFSAWLEERLGQAGLMAGVQISVFMARQKVNVLMLERVSNLLLADEPELVQVSTDRWVWRVPVDLTLPSRGRVGRVGEVEVDARYGEIRYSEELLVQIADRAKELAQQASPSTK